VLELPRYPENLFTTPCYLFRRYKKQILRLSTMLASNRQSITSPIIETFTIIYMEGAPRTLQIIENGIRKMDERRTLELDSPITLKELDKRHCAWFDDSYGPFGRKYI